MRHRTGAFDLDRLGPSLRPFCPREAFHTLHAIPLAGLKARGKKLIMLDVDNTLVHWRSEDFTQEVLDWIEEAKALGFGLCILSNTRHPDRLQRLSEKLGVPTVRDRFKPSTRMYKRALKQFKVTADESVMVGDQILTDILGANRSGIEAIWVHRLHPREFIGTKFNRAVERVILALLYRALPVLENLPEDTQTRETLAKQFLKFGIVGGTSTVIDYGLFFFLHRKAVWGGEPLGIELGRWMIAHAPFFSIFSDPMKASVPPIQAFSTSVAIINSFFLNRRWTFGMTGAENRGAQFSRFLVLSVSVMILTTLLVTVLNHWMGTVPAKLIATVVMAFVNFGGQRLWAFKKH